MFDEGDADDEVELPVLLDEVSSDEPDVVDEVLSSLVASSSFLSLVDVLASDRSTVILLVLNKLDVISSFLSLVLATFSETSNTTFPSAVLSGLICSKKNELVILPSSL